MAPDYKNIFEAFLLTYNKYSSKEAIYYKKNKDYAHFTYEELYRHIKTFSSFLLNNSVKKNDKVAIIIDNDPSWPIAFLSLMEVGAVAVPLNHKLEHEEIELFLRHSESKFILTSTNIYPRIKDAAESVSIRTLAIDFEQILKGIKFSPKKSAEEETTADDLALIVYTSGTTQAPKGVMLTHRNLLANVESLKKLRLINETDCLIAMLPFYHVYPFMVTMLLPLLSGARISFPFYYDFQEIMECMKKTGVTIFAGVPRVFNLFRQKIRKTIRGLFVIKRLLLMLLLKVSSLLRKYTGFNLAKFILTDLHSRLGERLRFMISGGAKLQKEIAYDFYSWGFTMLEGYGLTETSPVVAFNTPGKSKIGSVGKPVPEIQVKINNPDEKGRGEILIKGENVAKGYYKENTLTLGAYKEGWFLSGDLGFIDKKGFLYVTGREKEMIVLSTGKKINPEELEIRYSESPYIKEICIFIPFSKSAEKDVLSAVIFPDYEYFKLKGTALVKDKIRDEIENISRGLPLYKRIQRYTIISEALPKTILGKVKRYEVEKTYASYGEERTKPSKVLPRDEKLLSSPICQKALEHLSNKLKKSVNLDDHLELDLGLDSLEQIGLFLEFQRLTGADLKGEDFLGISTVRELLKKLKAASIELNLKEEITLKWAQILKTPLKDKLRESVSIRQSLLPKTINFIILIIFKTIARVFFVLETKGKNNLPQKGPFIICPNHSSYLDGILIASSLNLSLLLNTYFLGYAIYFKHPLISWADKLLRLIPIDPSTNLVDSLKICSFLLGKSKILCIFPEGRRSIKDEIGEFKRGAGILIEELNVPAFPVYIKGTYKAWPLHKMLPRPGKVTITFGKPLAKEELSNKQGGIDIYKNIVDNIREEIINLRKSSQRTD